MAALKIILAASGNHQVTLTGTHDGTTFTVTKLELPDIGGGAASEFDLSEPLDGLMEWLGTPTGDNYPLKPSLPDAVLLSATWEYTNGKKIFGKTFQATAAVDTKLEVFIAADGGGTSQVLLGVCGRISLDAGGATFASEPFCMEMEFPLGTTPRVSLGLPDVGLRIPRLDLPWAFPGELPLSLPLTLPARSFDFPPLGGRVSYRAISVDVAAAQLTIEVRGFVIEGLQQSFEADVKLVVKDEQIDIAQSSIRVIRPQVGNPFTNFPKWFFDDDCLILAGDKQELNKLLGWLAPECDELLLDGDVAWTIRLLRDGNSVEELRLDLQPKTDQEVVLPGFKLTLPKDSVFHLVFRQSDEGDRSFWVGLTIVKDASATLSLPFTWNRDNSSRERLKSDKQSDQTEPPRGIGLTATLVQELTLLVARFSGDDRQFFKKSSTALSKLDISNPTASCQPSAESFTPLSANDVKITFNGDLLRKLKLPFLRDELASVKQVIEVTNVSPPTVDFGSQSIGMKLTIQVNVGLDLANPALALSGEIEVTFFWETMAFRVNHDNGLNLKLPNDIPKQGEAPPELFGLKWSFQRAPGNAPDFKLLTKNSNYQIMQAPGTRLELTFDRATRPDQPIKFEVTNFALSAGGISLDAVVMNSPAKLNSLDTEFRFTEGVIQIRDNRIAGFSVGGSGPLPPALVGPAIASIRLQFSQNDDYSVHLISADARIQGDSLLKCDSTRFQFALTALGLKFVEEDGRYHLYFTISGMARFVLASGDDDQGPLGWLPAVEMQMVECPLTTDISVLARHINFLIPLPKPQTFSFLGCFEFELRAIGYAPLDPVFREPTPAMIISGQIKFSADADAIDARVDFHNLHIGLPKAGKFFPQLYLKGLGLKLSVGSAFELSGSVEFLDEGTDLQGGVTGEGFHGRGDVQIQGLPRITAGFAFLRVRRSSQDSPVKAWFLYLEANRFSLEFPVIRMFLREVGIGFGYRFTLAMIKSVDEVNDPRQLLKVLKEQAKRAGELSQFAAWRVDLEEPGEDPRWTIALRAMIAQNSIASSPTDWNAKKEEELPNLFLLDAVLALRSDLTFLMVARAWFLTNYYDFTMEKPPALRQQPLLTGFVMLSPRKKRLLANLSSNPDAVFGEHSPVPEIVKLAIRGTRFSATLLVEPGLMHYELGWPNQLRWEQNFGDVLKLQFCGGMIYRLSKTEFVIGQSFLARGELKFQAGVDFGFVGARLSATASVAYGARYIGVLAFKDTTQNSAFYGGAGIEINVAVSVEFWIEIDLLFGSITLDFSFSFAVNFTASVEIGILLTPSLGVRGTATLGLGVMGHDLHFAIRVALNEGAVGTAFNLTEKFLHVGLEAGEVESIPGTGRTQRLAAGGLNAAPIGGFNLVDATAHAPVAAAAAEMLLGDADVAEPFNVMSLTAAAKDGGEPFETPSYRVMLVTVGRYAYFMLIPAAELLDETRTASRESHRERGFLPVPPATNQDVDKDFELIDWLIQDGTVEQAKFGDLGEFKPFSPAANPDRSWKVAWDETIVFSQLNRNGNYATGSNPAGNEQPVKIRHWLGLAYDFKHAEDPLVLPDGVQPRAIEDWEDIDPVGDPALLFDAEDDVVDQRVHDPSDDAFEAAVRGAVEQFKSSPYLRRSRGEYDVTLRQAFDHKSTIYSTDGQTTTSPGQNLSPAHQKSQQVFQTRSVILRKLVSDFQQHVTQVRNAESDGQAVRFDATSLCCRLGLVFRADLDAMNEVGSRREKLEKFVEKLNKATIQQRTEKDKPAPTDDKQPIRVFNEPDHSFDEAAPTLDRLVHHTHEGSVGLDWELKWTHSRPRVAAIAAVELTAAGSVSSVTVKSGSRGYSALKPPVVSIEAPDEGGTAAELEVDVSKIDRDTGELQSDAIRVKVGRAGSGYTFVPAILISPPPLGNSEANPEQHLDHYLIRRKWLDGSGGDREFRIKPADVLHLVKEKTGDGSEIAKLKRLRPRFQFIDHFDDEPADFLASLPPDGRRYAYTIVPIDLTGIPSSRPRTVVVRRRPASPPPVVTQSEFVVDYSWPKSLTGNETVPKLWPVERISYLWTPPVDPEVGPRIAVAGLRLVFRRDEVLALGQYAQDSDTGGPRANGLPTSNARPLRTDETFEFSLSESEIKELTDPEGRQRRFSFQLTVDKSEATNPDLEARLKSLHQRLGVFAPSDATQPNPPWQPKAWRVFVQAKSASGVYSALIPVDLRLRFHANDLVPLQQSAPEERRPGALEWLPLPVTSAMLPPRDQLGKGGFARVPMPPKDSIKELDANGLGRFELHPARRRCLQMVWNQIGTPEAPVAPVPAKYPREFHAAFDLYEFDADADTAEEINKIPGIDPIRLNEWLDNAQLQRRQQFELLPDELLLVTPSDTSDTQKWEAWYPSMVKRRELAIERSEQSPGKPRSDATYSPWYSWRESLLVWPDVVNTEIEAELNGVKQRWGKLIINAPGRYIRNERLHPLLAFLIADTRERLGNDDSGTARTHTVELGPVPASPDQWQGFQAATNSSVDPHGWSVLTRLGLATSFVIRDPQGQPVPAPELLPQLFVAITKAFEVDKLKQFQQHLHVEMLYQPAKAVELSRSESREDRFGESVAFDDLLAVVQVSLRPVLAAYASYFRYSLKFPADVADIKVTIDVSASTNTYFLKFPDDPSLDVMRLEPGLKTEVTIRRPVGNHPATLLIRGLSLDGTAITQPTVTVKDSTFEVESFDATDPASRNFEADSKDVAKVLTHDTGNKPEYWETLRQLIEALNSTELTPDKVTLTLPDPNSSVGSELLAWLQRFFDHGGNWASSPADATGPWLATAYLRTAPVMAISPDKATGLLEYFHPVEDLYAHAWRYYIRPVGRYERLWLSLGQSHTLFRDEDGNVDSKQINRNVTALTRFQPPPPGGLDLILPRIRPVSAPTILYSGRLDGPRPKDADGLQPKPPGKSWQVVLAKHPEQILVERNRTLARRLAYRQLSVALLRRFQFGSLTRPFNDARITPEVRADEPILAANQKLFFKISDGPEKPLPLADNDNNIDGLHRIFSAAIVAEFPNKGIVVDRCDRMTDNAVPTRISLILVRTPKPVTLLRRLVTDGSDEELLKQRLAPVPVKTESGIEPQLPGDLLPIRRHDPLKEFSVDSIHELRDYDLPPRLGRFGQGAIVYQWQALPYYYEHLVLAVAQSTDVVSDITTALQRDLEYASPEPRAVMDSIVFLINNQVQRHRRVQIRLENFWNCLPQQPSAQDRWPMEDPHTDSPHDPRPYSALPDPAVVYQLVLRRPGGVIQALSQLYFEASTPHQYSVRKFPSQVGTQTYETIITARRPWGVDSSRLFEEYLETRLEVTGGSNVKVRRAISSRHRIDPAKIKPDLTGSAKQATPAEPLEFPQTATLALTQRLTAAELAALETLLTREPLDNAFRVQASRFLDRIREVHSPQEFKFEDDSNPSPLDAKYELTIRPDFGGAPKFILSWSGLIPVPTALDELRNLVADTRSLSPPLRAAIRRMLSVLEGDVIDIREEVSVGLDQLTELADDPNFATIDPWLKQVTWAFEDPSKPMSDGQKQVLNGFDDGAGNSVLGWVNIAPCAGTMRALLEAIKQDDLKETFAPADVVPPTPTTGPLKDRVTIAAGELSWKQGTITEQQLAELQVLVGDAAFGQSFRDAVSRLMIRLKRLMELQLGFDKTETTPMIGGGHPLETRLTIDKSGPVGRVAWRLGPISPAERTALLAIADAASGFGPTFRHAVSRTNDIGDKLIVQVGIVELDFAPRPQPEDFSGANASLGIKAGCCRGAITFDGLMLVREEQSLEDACRVASDPGSIRHLYNDSLRAGFEGGELQIQAFRGSAEVQTTSIRPYLH